jgi:hypothetical protein
VSHEKMGYRADPMPMKGTLEGRENKEGVEEERKGWGGGRKQQDTLTLRSGMTLWCAFLPGAEALNEAEVSNEDETLSFEDTSSEEAFSSCENS